MASRRLHSIIGVAIVTVVALAAQVGTRPPEPTKAFEPGEPIEQPIPFSHKTHTAVQLNCLDCHAIEEPGDFAGFPAESKCMACHIAIKTDSPHIQQLSAAVEAGRAIEWNRVYQVEEFVYFSHDLHHREAGVECTVCHGAVAEQDVLFQATSVDMYACMRCHEQNGAPNNCEVCHDTH